MLDLLIFRARPVSEFSVSTCLDGQVEDRRVRWIGFVSEGSVSTCLDGILKERRVRRIGLWRVRLGYMIVIESAPVVTVRIGIVTGPAPVATIFFCIVIEPAPGGYILH